jgi:DNA-binding transcriptional MerR regulator/methylmalonyl-CoA mutase cobalamin-binding subunit
MWEKRYGAVVPARTPTGHRLYTDEDIERLVLLSRATAAGESIGQIATLSREELARLVPPEELQRSASGQAEQADFEYHLKLCQEAVENLDSTGLEARLLRASLSLGQQVFLEKVLHPLLQRTGDLWANGTLKVAHEHLASAVTRSLLGTMVVSGHNHGTGPIILCTTPSGQLHEFGALMAAVTAVSLGWQADYLGPNLPAEDIAAAVNQRRAAAVALSIAYPPDDDHLHLELRKLRQYLDDSIVLFAGGHAARAYRKTLAEIGAIRVEDLAGLRKRLTQSREKLAKGGTG